MTRRLLPLVLILGLLAAACGEQTHAEVEFGSGATFTSYVADAQDNVGQMPSVAVSAEGMPFVAYFGFPEELEEEEVAAPRPIDSPPLPGVLMTSVHDGIWSRGAAAIEQTPANSTVPFGPGEIDAVASMEPDNVAGTATAIDADGGIHVVWSSDTGVWYGHNPDGSAFDVTQVFELDRKLRVAGPLGAPSIALDDSGTPWIAFSQASRGGVEVTAATLEGSGWVLQEVAMTGGGAGPGAPPGDTAVGVLGDGSPVVLYPTDVTIEAATIDGERGWSSLDTVAQGDDIAGLSLASDGEGGLIASYYMRDEISVANSKDGTSWSRSTVASVGAGENDAGRSTGIGVDESGTAYVTWYDPGTDDVRLASGTGDAFEEIETSGTQGGSQPSLGVASDGSAVYVAWYDAVNQNLMLGAYGEVGELALAVPSPTAAPAGGGTTAPPTQECTTAEDGVVTITAAALAFDTNCIEVPAGEPFTIAFDNQDEGVQHNVAVFPSAEELTDPLMKGDVITGVDQIDYQVEALEEGEYYFHCDIHPNMNGVLRVVGQGGGGGAAGAGGGGGAITGSVTASGLAFDTDTISLPAGEPTTITFINDDAGVQHNIAIYPSADEISPDTALFQGDLITGPAQVEYEIPALDPGEYYFHCDVHPNMNGTVVVG
jgi:plastocyanin